MVTPVRPVSALTIEEASRTTGAITNSSTITGNGRPAVHRRWCSRNAREGLAAARIKAVLCHCSSGRRLLSDQTSVVAFGIDDIHLTGTCIATSNRFKYAVMRGTTADRQHRK